jgi:hypothetical protein
MYDLYVLHCEYACIVPVRHVSVCIRGARGNVAEGRLVIHVLRASDNKICAKLVKRKQELIHEINGITYQMQTAPTLC